MYYENSKITIGLETYGRLLLNIFNQFSVCAVFGV